MSTTFKQFVNEIRLTQLSNWEYELPEYKEQQIFDFYMLTMFPKKVDDTELDHHLQNCRNTLLTSLKEELLKDVFYAISQEIKHLFENSNFNEISKKTLEKFLNKNQIKFLYNYDQLKDSFNEKIIIKKYNKYEDILGNEDGSKYLISALQSGLTEKQFVQMCKILFGSDEIEWEHLYGGKIWGNICQSWLNLYNSKTLDNIMVWIDHVYDLEHNTGSIFKKLSSYNFDVKSKLNFKRDLNLEYQIIHKISPKMKTLALPIIKQKKKQGESLFRPSKESLHSIRDKVIYHYNYEIYNRLFEQSNPQTLLEKYTKITTNNEKFQINFNNLEIKNYNFVNRNGFIEECAKLIIFNNLSYFYKNDEKFLILRDLFTYSTSKEKNINNIKTIEEIKQIIKLMDSTSLYIDNNEISKTKLKINRKLNFYSKEEDNPFKEYLL